MALTKVPSNLDATVAITQSASDNSTNIATTAYVTTAIANLVDGAPSTLNTLDEIAAALNDDAALNTTLTNSIATKLPLAGGSLTGGLTITAGGDNLKLKRSSFDDILLGIGTGNNQSGIHITNTTDTVTIASIHENAPAASFVMDSSGNIGIGLDNPSAPLHIDAAGMGDVYSGRIENTTTDTDHYNVVRWFQGSSGSAVGMIGTGGSATGNAGFRNTFVVGTQNSTDLVLMSADTERWRIDSSGHFKGASGSKIVQTIASGGGNFLEVTHSGNEAWSLAVQSGTGVDDYLDIGINGGTRAISIHEDGKIGMGISSGLARNLHIKGSNSDVGIQIEKDGIGELRVAYDSTGPYLYAENTNHGFRVYAGGGIRLKIDPDGAIDNVNSPRFVSTKNSNEHQFTVSFSHGTAYQHVDLILEDTWWGSLEVHLTGTYSNQNMSGLLAKRFALGLNNNNSQYTNQSSTIAAIGATADNFYIGEVVWDATLGKYKVTISHRNANGNVLHMKVLAYSGNNTNLHDKAANFTVSNVYTSGSSYPKQQYENPAFLAYLTAGQAITTSYTKIGFNAETYDFGTNHSNGTFTAPERGIYQFGANFLVYPHTQGVLNSQWWKAGSAYSPAVQQGYANQSHTAVNTTIAAFLNRTETFEFRISGSVNPGCNVYGTQCYWYGYKVGGF